jgi:ribonuclease BN (tRNA processing enzyme)
VTTNDLTLTPIGVGAAYARPDEVQSAYLVASSTTTVCLDLGAGTLSRMRAHIAPEALSAIVITHLHADHCVDLLSLRVYMEWGPGRGHTVRVIGPAGLKERLQAFAGEEGWDAIRFDVLDGPRGSCELGDLRLVWAEVPHTDPTFAIRVEAGGRSVTYSADCGPNDALVALATNTDVLLAECSLGLVPADAGAIHLSATDVAIMARAAGVKRVVLTHCTPEHDRQAVLVAAAEAFGGPVAWARQDEEVAVSTG